LVSIMAKQAARPNKGSTWQSIVVPTEVTAIFMAEPFCF